MPVERLRFYQRRQQRIFAEKFKAITIVTPTDWKELNNRHKLLSEELDILQGLIETVSQSVFRNRHKEATLLRKRH
jgi:hypothetical protein